MSKLYTLKLRVGKEYYPVQYDTGLVCWDEQREPTVFSEAGKERALAELAEGGYEKGDLLFEPYLYIAQSSEAPSPMTGDEHD